MDLASRTLALQSAAERAAGEPALEKRAQILADEVVPAMAAVREVADRIEEGDVVHRVRRPRFRSCRRLETRL
jgi:glutamine synthetase type III